MQELAPEAPGWPDGLADLSDWEADSQVHWTSEYTGQQVRLRRFTGYEPGKDGEKFGELG